MHVRANDCAGLRAGTRTVWLDRRTLLPLRVREVRGSARSTTNYTYTRVAAPLPTSAFAAPRVRLRHERVNYGFRRTAPARVRAAVVRPAAADGAFRRVSSWPSPAGPRGRVRTGAEGSIAPHRKLFAAVYRRGFERIDVTQRLAGGLAWPGDPFGAECIFCSASGRA